jgi:hypothetical protein
MRSEAAGLLICIPNSVGILPVTVMLLGSILSFVVIEGTFVLRNCAFVTAFNRA